jgi:hypothetical protein
MSYIEDSKNIEKIEVTQRMKRIDRINTIHPREIIESKYDHRK